MNLQDLVKGERVKITGALQVPSNPKVIQDLTFANPFEEHKEFRAYFEHNSQLIIPRAYPIDIDGFTEDLVDSPCNFQLAEGYALRDYQSEAVEEIVSYFLDKTYGQLLLTASCGSGKSYALAGILNALGKKTLVLSHLTILNNQIYGEITQSIIGNTIAIISSKTVDFPDVAIASYQALASSKDLLTKCANTYSILVLDEAENCVSAQRLRVILSLKFKYLIFMTATPSKELTKLTPAVKYIHGDKVVTMSQPEEAKVHSHHLMVDYRHLSWQSPTNKNMYKVQFGKFLLRSSIIQDIVNLVVHLKMVEKIPGCIWVVADLSVVKLRCKELLEASGISVAIIDSSTSNKKRTSIINGITTGDISVVIGSKPLSAGLSIKELIVGIRLIPSSSSEEELAQSTGRLNRMCNFKTKYTPLWIDYVCSGSIEYGAKARYKLYQKSTLGANFCKASELCKNASILINSDR